MTKTKIKILGQYNTKESIIEFILKQSSIPQNKNIDILEPSSGLGNFLKILTQEGYKNITSYEIDRKYAFTGEIIADFLKVKIKKKFDFC